MDDVRIDEPSRNDELLGIIASSAERGSKYILGNKDRFAVRLASGGILLHQFIERSSICGQR
jgi:hypothetical protein